MTTVDTSANQLDLSITGMSCNACAMTIEKGLNHLAGVEATVNFATESARVTFDASQVDTVKLVSLVESLGYGARPLAETTPDMLDAEVRERVAMLKSRLTASIALGLPVVLVSMFAALQFANWQWYALAFSAPVVTWGAWPFHRAAMMNTRHRSTTMDTLISLGIVAAVSWSVWALVWGDAASTSTHDSMTSMANMTGMNSGVHVYFEVAVAVTIFLLAGRYFEARAKRRAGDALRALLALGARTATILRDGEEVTIDAVLIRVGDMIVVRPGEIIAADGVVMEGASSIDASTLTGESVPVDVQVGSKVTGTTVNLTGRLVVRARRVGADSTFAQITKLVRDAQSSKAPVQRLADRVSSVFVPTVILLSLATFIAWYFLGDDVERLADAFEAAVSVLIIACPCALGLATPTALMVGSGRAAQMGIVIKGVDVLQSTRRIDTVVFDKTGTVTTGVMQLLDVVVADGATRAEVLGFAGALEFASEHPVAKAIASAARAELGQLASVQQFESIAGQGTVGVVDGHRVMVGGEQLLNSRTVIISGSLREALKVARDSGNTAVLVAYDGMAKAVCVVADRPKTNSAAAIASLRELGLRPVLLTGDNLATALAVAEQVGIETDDQHVIAGVLPAEKVRVVADLQERGYAVAMVGDGVNDAAALAQSDVGIAMGTGTDVAMSASDLTIVSGDLRLVTDAILLSRATLRTISANVFWAFAYNAAAIPLAALGYMNPMWAGLAMALSSVFVVSNSLRLRNAKLSQHTAFVHATR
jgi:Cu+-exporting ATPase